MLYADALVEPATHAVTLTTARPNTSSAEFREAHHLMIRDVRRKFGPVRFVNKVEFTTGEAVRSGGYRRLHSHAAWKDLDPSSDVGEVEDVIRHHWRRLLGAPVVEVATLRSVGAAMAYVAAVHHSKDIQAPPPGWRGMTVRWSQGRHRYCHRPVAELRAEARDQLTRDRLAWRAEQDGASADEAALLAELRLLEIAGERDAGGWSIVRGSFTPGGLWLPADPERDALRPRSELPAVR